ncbi:DUF3849 domain-containing protein [Pseudoflavonifractor sp. 524-17]|uniref:DUF3849 domain-containing protein n=1 Tax=Pseudoflavonifractor sp. 524-17 TaxID=2304577 RepID=UPI00137A00DF|nr:DUF3849 domain-containing protein [Pseudoflavonifractor sp. 524-17]NCE65686.1 DUF3849 domain-containing protein [Pseudoflavonifractor sp. 524-17]
MDHTELTTGLYNKMAAELLALRSAEHQRPLYRHDGSYAWAHGELDQYRACQRANAACAQAIDAAIQAGFDGMHLNADVKGVLAEFGPERVAYVLAATIQRKDWDERFSRSNQAWAAAVPMFVDEDRRFAFVINSHSTLLNGFVSMARKEMDAMREQLEQKPSIKAQLAAKPVSGEPPAAKPKDREVR